MPTGVPFFVSSPLGIIQHTPGALQSPISHREFSSAGLEHLLDMQEVAGSNPVAPTFHTSTPMTSTTPTFSAFALAPSLLEGLEAMGFSRPTEIQAQAIPLILEGRDLIGSAQTGTGKTAAFLLPILSQLSETPAAVGPRVLIVAPTRELVLQIDQQVEGFGYFTSVGSKAIYGGNDGRQWNLQRDAMESGADILVATPGRLIQFLQLGIAPLAHIETLVLDEADRMLDMGFFPDIKRILESLPARKQTLLFSATMPPEVLQLAKQILHKPASINIALSQPAERIDQHKAFVDETAKVHALVRFFAERSDVRSAIIFAEKKTTVRDLHLRLARKGLSVVAIHSDLSQDERETALTAFRSRQSRILVATDIVARGIDIDEIDLVVNYNVPISAESYVHRIGRTARAESHGESLTLASYSELEALAQIEKHLGSPIPVVMLEGSVAEASELAPVTKPTRQGTSRPSGPKRPSKSQHRKPSQGGKKGGEHRPK